MQIKKLISSYIKHFYKNIFNTLKIKDILQYFNKIDCINILRNIIDYLIEFK